MTAGPHTSIAMTWAHPDFRVSAVTRRRRGHGHRRRHGGRRDPRADCSSSAACRTATPCPTGTLVVTSGLGGVYPRGMPIGHGGGRGAAVGGVGAGLPGPAGRGARAGVSHALIVPAGTVVGRRHGGRTDSRPVSAARARRIRFVASVHRCCWSVLQFYVRPRLGNPRVAPDFLMLGAACSSPSGAAPARPRSPGSSSASRATR